MDKDINLLENDQLFKTLFEYSDDKDEKLYKNDLFIPSTEENDLLKKKKEKNQTEIFRDKILNKLSLEDYTLFPPKNDSILMNDNEMGKDKEDQEKLFEEEIDHLRNLHRLNYLTFSPFGLSFFPDLNSIIDKNEDKNPINTHENEEEINEKEKKILNILDFDYNNYEINNDLLFNVSMGFIDINKLKHENLVSSENFIPRSERFKGRQLKKNATEQSEQAQKKPDNDITIKDVEFKSDLMNKLVRFVKDNESNEFYTSTIDEFYKELNVITNLTKNIEKNKLLLKWEKTFTDRQKLYKKYLIEQQDKERKKRKKETLRKEFEKKIEQEKMLKMKEEKEFEEELEKIRQKGLKNYEKNKGKKNRKSVIVGTNGIRREYSIGLRGSNVSNTLRSFYSIRSSSSCSANKNKIDKKRRKSQKSFHKTRRNTSDYNNERYGYMKRNNDYYFDNI